MTRSKFWPALAVLVGTAIGAGYLGMPYVISKSGFIPGVICLLLVALFMLFTKLYLGEVCLRTKGNHQLAGYAQKYLGKTGKIFMFFAMIFGIYSALIAYLMAEGTSLSYLFFGNENYSFIFSLFFWLVLSSLAYIGLSALKKYEKIGMILVMLTLGVIFIFYFKNINYSNLSYFNSHYLFLPFGLILFSFLAFSAMPEVRRVLSGQERFMRGIIIFGIVIPAFVYFLFTFLLVGNFGLNVPPIATMALGRFFSILGILTMFTAYFTSTLAIRDMFRFDFNLGRFRGWLFACILPLILFLFIYFFNFSSFIQLLSISGIVSGGLTGILILFMNIKAKKLGDRNPEYSVFINWWIIALMAVVFILAVVGEFLVGAS